MDDDGHEQIGFERSQCLRDALRRLPAEQREVLVLRHIAGLSPGEIAERLGKTEGSVHGLHHRGRGALQAALRELEAAPVIAARLNSASAPASVEPAPRSGPPRVPSRGRRSARAPRARAGARAERAPARIRASSFSQASAGSDTTTSRPSALRLALKRRRARARPPLHAPLEMVLRSALHEMRVRDAVAVRQRLDGFAPEPAERRARRVRLLDCLLRTRSTFRSYRTERGGSLGPARGTQRGVRVEDVAQLWRAS